MSVSSKIRRCLCRMCAPCGHSFSYRGRAPAAFKFLRFRGWEKRGWYYKMLLEVDFGLFLSNFLTFFFLAALGMQKNC